MAGTEKCIFWPSNASPVHRNALEPPRRPHCAGTGIDGSALSSRSIKSCPGCPGPMPGHGIGGRAPAQPVQRQEYHLKERSGTFRRDRPRRGWWSRSKDARVLPSYCFFKAVYLNLCRFEGEGDLLSYSLPAPQRQLACLTPRPCNPNNSLSLREFQDARSARKQRGALSWLTGWLGGAAVIFPFSLRLPRFGSWRRIARCV